MTTSRRTRRPGKPLRLERLEGRLVLATIIVTSTGDSVDSLDGEVTLREAILESNAVAGPDVIEFSIAGSGVRTISPMSVLPTITDSVTLDATTITGFADSPMVEIDGTSAGTGVTGLRVQSDNTTIRGLVINRFSGNGIVVNGVDNFVLETSYIGTDPTGQVGLGNGDNGVYLLTTTNSRIGGTATNAGNLISGNGTPSTRDGIHVWSSSNVQILGNRIGTDINGESAIPNTNDGIHISNGSTEIIVGGVLSGSGNLISGNGFDGIEIRSATGNLVQGNIIGLSSDGSSALPNKSGVEIDGANSNTIGGSVLSARNVIGGNTGNGIEIYNSASSNVVIGNYVGVQADGNTAAPNGANGVWLANGATQNTIGGASPAERNVVSGNGSDGVEFWNSNTIANTLIGNYIGTNASGTAAVPNLADGVRVGDGASGNTIGGTLIGESNVISGNASDGVQIQNSGSSNNRVIGNRIGTNPTGETSIPNQNDGVQLVAGASGNWIGGSAPGEGNLISGNGFDGVELNGNGTTNNRIEGNFIGTDTTGMNAIPNASDGIELEAAMGNFIGGGAPGAGNVISGNGSDGIDALLASASNNILGNMIGVASDGVMPLSNQSQGILLREGVVSFQIGGVLPGEANTIAHNARSAIYLDALAGDGHTIRGNSIFMNSRLGIELTVPTEPIQGVTANDSGDSDAGANGLQNHPLLSNAVTSGTSLAIDVDLNSVPNSTFTIDLYASPAFEGINEGKRWLGETTVTTDFSGNVSFPLTLAESVVAGEVITATATSGSGSTSEFSAGVSATNVDGTPTLRISDAGITEGDSGMIDVVFDVTLSNTYASNVTVDFSTSGDSATSGVDFVSASGTVTFLPGSTLQTISVSVLGDTVDEDFERLFVDLSSPVNVTVVDGQGSGWIVDQDGSAASVPLGAATRDTSEFMLGTVFVTVVAFESDGSIDADLERFTPYQINDLKRKVNEGLAWWENMLDLQNTVHDLDFEIDFTFLENPVQTPYEPLSRPGITSPSDQELWINSFLDLVDANTASNFHPDLDAYNHQRRSESGTNWAFTIFFNNSEMDADGGYVDRNVAWAHAGGPHTVIQSHRHAHTVAHEVGHIFYNLDEYVGGPSYFARRGYYNTQNLNALEDHPDPSLRVTSIAGDSVGIAFETNTSSPTSLEMVGWLDSDDNGVFDVLDVPLSLTGTGEYDLATQEFRFQGMSNVNTLPNLNPSGLGNDITLSRVSRLQLQIDQGAWVDVASYDAYSAVIDVTVASSPGSQMNFRTIDDSTGMTSSVWSQVVPEYDFGDAPSSFPTELNNSAGYHVAIGPRLGPLRDGEVEGQASSDATGDGSDEDGVDFGNVIVGMMAGFTVDLQNASQGRLDAWIDFDSDGQWQVDEKITHNVSLVGGLQTLNFIVPNDSVTGDLHARIRVSSVGGLDASGLAVDGEVEDYVLRALSAQPAVEVVQINDGVAQRSSVEKLEVVFDREVSAPASAFSVYRRDNNSVVDSLQISNAKVDDRTVSTIRFGPGSHVTGDSLANGEYELRVLGNAIQWVSGGPTMPTDYVFGDQQVDGFFRKYGDQNGTGLVDLLDFASFRQTFGKLSGDLGYQPSLDSDGDAVISLLDFAAFRQAFGS